MKDLAAQTERFLYVGVDDEVDVTLTVTCVNVFETVPFFRKRTERFREKLECRYFDADLAAMCAEYDACDTDDIADIEHTEMFVHFFAEHVLTEVYLNLAFRVHDMAEAGFTMTANCHQAACDADFFFFVFFEVTNDLCCVVCKVESFAERFTTLCADRIEFIKANFDQLIHILLSLFNILFVFHLSSSTLAVIIAV